MNMLYRKLYPKKVFTSKEAYKIIKNIQVCKNTLQRLLSSHLIKRIRKGLYYIVPLDDPDYYPDRIVIASKLRPTYALSSQTALALHFQEPLDSTIYISAPFSAKIRIKEHVYTYIKANTEYNTKEIEYLGFPIMVTQIERTIADCLWTRTVKITRLIELLRTKNTAFDFSRLLNYLEKVKRPILYHKIGLLLDACKDVLGLSASDLEKIGKKLSKKTFYAKEKGLRLMRPRYRYVKKWNIMITEELYEKISPMLQNPLQQNA